MNIPGDLVRRAAANVSSTVSTVSSTVSSVATGSVGRGRRQNSRGFNADDDPLIANAKEKYSMTVKCTPNKDAQTIASLAIKSGFMLKRNEQGSFNKKFLCTVPHMFLYYFDSEVAEAPRGVIDLELYNNISRDDDKLRVAVAEEERLRTFYFQHEDREVLNEWLTSLIRDRYFAVVDERDAYQQMQFEMTGAIDNASLLHKSSQMEKEELEQQLQLSNKQYSLAISTLQGLLVVLGITEEEMSQLTDLHKISDRLNSSIMDVKSTAASRNEESNEALEKERTACAEAIAELNTQITIEKEQNAAKDAELIRRKAEYEHRLQEANLLTDNVTLNFQMAITAKQTAENKATLLAEQKKVLVKEVKNLRKEKDDAKEMIAEFEGINSKLTEVLQVLRVRLKELEAENESYSRTLAAKEHSPGTQEVYGEVVQVEAQVDNDVGDEEALQVQKDDENNHQMEPDETSAIISDNKCDSSGVTLEDLNELLQENRRIRERAEERKARYSPIPFSSYGINVSSPHPGNAGGQNAQLDSESSANDFINNSNSQSPGVEESSMQSTRTNFSRTRSIISDTAKGIVHALQSNNNPSSAAGHYHEHYLQNAEAAAAAEAPKPKFKGLLSDGVNDEIQANNVAIEKQKSTSIDAGPQGGSDWLLHRNSEYSEGADSGTWDLPASGADLQELGKVTDSDANDQQSADEGSTKPRSSLLGSTMSRMIRSSSSVANEDVTSPAGTDTTSAGSSNRLSLHMPSLGISSMFGKSGTRSRAATTATDDQSIGSPGVAITPASASKSNNFYDPPFAEDHPDRYPVTMRLLCLRCLGTVEGPRFSTCKCSVPALHPEDLQDKGSGGNSTGQAMLSGILSTGSSVAGGIAGGVGSLMHLGVGSGRKRGNRTGSDAGSSNADEKEDIIENEMSGSAQEVDRDSNERLDNSQNLSTVDEMASSITRPSDASSQADSDVAQI